MTDASERFRQAVELDRDGRLPQAVEAYTALIRDFGGFREAYCNLGSLYARLEKPDDAMECFDRALEHGEDHIVHFNIGSIHFKRKEYKKAVVRLNRSRRLNGDFVLASLVMGLSYSRMKNRKAAENCFREVLRLWPGNLIALTALSILYYQSGRLQGSLKLVDRILVLDIGNTGIRKLRAKILYQLNRTADYASEIKLLKETREEFTLFDEFIQAIPAETFTDRYGTLDEKMERLREKARDRTDASSVVSLSLCHLLKGDTDMAVDMLMEARKRALH